MRPHHRTFGLPTLGCAVGVFCLLAGAIGAAEVNPVELLRSRLDLDRPGLEKVKAAAATPDVAVRELLLYYRARTSVVNPDADRRQRSQVRGRYASADDLIVADDAVKNILIACPEYPRHDFGQTIDWFTNRNPKHDFEWLIQLHRQYSWMALGRAYWHTGDEKYAEAYARQLRDWLEHCPLDPKGGAAWRMLEVGIRGHAWTLHWNWFLDSPHYTPDLLVRQLNCLYDHAQRLTGGRTFTGNNWGLMEAEGAAFIAINFPEFKDAGEWQKKSCVHLVGQIKGQLYPDGMQHELCFGYHAGCIHWFRRTLLLARANGLSDLFPPHYAATVERMYEVLGRCAHPDGRHSMFGDDRPHSVQNIICEGAAAFPDNPTLAFLAGDQRKSAPPTAFALPDSGFYSLRSGWDKDAIHLLLKCGPDGGWHCQPDNGTFELYAFGRYLMPDSGCYIYSGDAEGRKWFRQTRVHQTLTLDGRDSAYKPHRRLWQTGNRLDALVVQNSSYAGLLHRRAVLFIDKSFFLIVDDAVGADDGDVDVHFQFAPGPVAVDVANAAAHSAFAEGANVLVQGLAQPELAMAEEEGHVSLAYGERQPRTAVRFRQVKTAATPAVRFVTAVMPYRQACPVVAIQPVGTGRAGGERCEFGVTMSGKTLHAGYDLAAGTVWCHE